MLETSRAVPAENTSMWNIHAFGNEQMSMWNSISRECSQNEYLAKIVVANFLANTKHRLIFYKNTMDNVFLYDNVKAIFSVWFSQMQSAYWGFTRLAVKWKRRNPKIQIHTDLYMNELEIAHLHTYSLMQLDNVYLFTLSNLVNLITTAITRAVHFRHAPLHVKNPYNNVEFSKSDLYNIYFRVLATYIKVPFFFRRFFECDFNIYRFKVECEVELREKAIREYVKTADYLDVFADVQSMMYKYDTNRYIRITNGFEKKLVVDAFRPFLATYYLSMYSFDTTQQNYCKLKLERDIPQFAYTNYLFGQRTGDKLRSPENPFVPTRYEKYHTKWEIPKPARLSVDHFMKSHIFDDRVFDRYVEQGDVNLAYTLPIYFNPEPEPQPPEMVQQEPATQYPQEEDDSETEPLPESDGEEEEVAGQGNAEERLSEVSDYNEEGEGDDYDW
jgi:hypothetical protein